MSQEIASKFLSKGGGNKIEDHNFSKKNNRTLEDLMKERKDFDKDILNDDFKRENIIDNKKVTIL